LFLSYISSVIAEKYSKCYPDNTLLQ
jgi:hypothetical protein